MGTMSRARREVYEAKIKLKLERREAVLALDLEHKGQSAISGILGLTRGQVAGILFRYGAAGRVINRAARKRISKNNEASARMARAAAAAIAAMHVKLMAETVTSLATHENVDNRITMAELTPSMCKYPIGNPRDWDNFRFCGEPIVWPGPYCQEHDCLCNLNPKNEKPPKWVRDAL